MTPGTLEAADGRAMKAMAAAARTVGIRLDGASVRRTSSRLCLSVEHGDYNGTDLFGVGTDRFLWCAFCGSDTNRSRLFSIAFPDEGVVEIDLGGIPPPGSPAIRDAWARFPLGVAYVLQESGVPLQRGVEGVIYSEIPGGGMSRSASLAINLILSFLDVNAITIEDRFRIAELARAVENHYIGSPCGILDQVMILFARKGMGVHYVPSRKCVEYVPLPPSAPPFRFVVLDTGTVRPGLEASTYRIRRQECEELVRLLNDAGMPVCSLADVTPEQYAAIREGVADVPRPLLRRLSYVHEAQRRFPRMLAAWRGGDIRAVGRVFREDGLGLRDDYEISGPEMETMCDIARTVPGVWGERMLGGGDKGAAGAIATPGAVPLLRDAVARVFPRRHPECAHRWSVSELSIVDGVTMLETGVP
jgi:galactokinase